MPWPLWISSLIEESLWTSDGLARSKVSCLISDRGVPATEITLALRKYIAGCSRTLNLDYRSPDVMHILRAELDDVLGRVKLTSLPHHGTRHRRGEFIRERFSGRCAM
jgi:hypothetical protein